MSQSSMPLSNGESFASELISRDESDQHVQHVIPTAIGGVPLPLAAYLKSGGSPDADVDGSVTAAEFDLSPASDEIYRIDRIELVICTTAAAAMTSFGDVAALTNGVTLKVLDEDEEVISDLLGGYPIKTLNDLAGWELEALDLASSSHTVKAVLRLPVPIRIEGMPAEGEAAEILRMTVADNLSSLVRLRCHVFGQIEGTLT